MLRHQSRSLGHLQLHATNGLEPHLRSLWDSGPQLRGEWPGVKHRQVAMPHNMLKIALIHGSSAPPPSSVAWMTVPGEVGTGRSQPVEAGAPRDATGFWGLLRRLDQVPYPAVLPPVPVTQHAVRVGVLSGEEAGPAQRTRRCGDVTVRERHTFLNQAVEMRCVHMLVAEGTNRVEALLVGDDGDDVWPRVGHQPRILAVRRLFHRVPGIRTKPIGILPGPKGTRMSAPDGATFEPTRIGRGCYLNRSGRRSSLPSERT